MGFTAFATVASSVISAAAAAKQGADARSQAISQADIQVQQATREREIAERGSEDFRREQSKLLARQRLTGRTDPSALLIGQNTAGEIELQAQRIKSGGATSATRLKQQAALNRAQGKQAFKTGLLRGGANVVGGALSLKEQGFFTPTPKTPQGITVPRVG